MPERQHIVDVIETYCRAENAKDKDMWMSLFSEDVVHEDPVGIATRRGKAELIELWDMAMLGNVDLRLTDEVIVCGNEAMALMACETGPEGARRTTGPIVDHFVFDESGKVVSVRCFYKT